MATPLSLRIEDALDSLRLPLQSAHTNRHASTGSNSAVASGARMHAEALAQKARLEERAAAAREQREQAALSAIRAPAITRLARSLPRPEPAWARLYDLASEGEAREELHSRLREESASRELDECTFMPMVTVRSGEMMEERAAAMRRAGLTAHATLYADAARREQKLAAARRPASAPAPPSAAAQAAAVARLHEAGEVAARRLRAAVATAARRDASGRRLFEPETGRPPTAGRASAPVHEQLYSLRFEAGQHAQAREEAERAETALVRARAGARSAMLAQERRRRRFASVFRALDERAAGVLDAWQAAELAEVRLLPEVAADVRRAAELVGGVALDEAGFCTAMEAAVASSRGPPRAYLGASVRKPPDVAPACTFAPTLDDNSRYLAQERRPSGVPIHVTLAQEWHAAEGRRAAASLEAEAALEASMHQPRRSGGAVFSEGAGLRVPLRAPLDSGLRW